MSHFLDGVFFMMQNYWQLFNTIQLYIAVRWFNMRVFWPIFVFLFSIFWDLLTWPFFLFSLVPKRQVSMKALRMSERQVCHLQELNFSGAGNFLEVRMLGQVSTSWDEIYMKWEWKNGNVYFFSLWATYLSHIQWHPLDFHEKELKTCDTNKKSWDRIRKGLFIY